MPSPVTIATGVADQYATGLPNQSHLVRGAASAAWWLFYLSGSDAINAIASADFSSWASVGSSTLGKAHGSEGRNFAFDSRSDADVSVDVFHMASAYRDSFDYTYAYHGRFRATSTSSYTFQEQQTGSTDSGGDSIVHAGPSTMWSTVTGVNPNGSFDHNPYGSNGSALGMQAGFQGGDTFASSWTNSTTGWFSPGSVTKQVSSTAVLDWGPSIQRKMLLICDDADPSSGSATNLKWSLTSGTTGSTPASVFSSNLSSSIGPGGWCALKRATNDAHVVALDDGSTTFRHARYNGSSWSAGDAIPAGSCGTGSNLFLATDGTSVYLFCFDSSGNLMTSKWTSGSGWSNWGQILASSGNDRRSLSGWRNIVSGNVGLVWTESVSGSWNIVGLATGPEADVAVMVYSVDGASASESVSFASSLSGREAVAAGEITGLVIGSGDSAGVAEGPPSIGPASSESVSFASSLGVSAAQASAEAFKGSEGQDAVSRLSALDQASEGDASATPSTSALEGRSSLDLISASDLASVDASAGDGNAFSGDDRAGASASSADSDAVAYQANEPGQASSVGPRADSDVVSFSEASELVASVAGIEAASVRDSAGSRGSTSSRDSGVAAEAITALIITRAIDSIFPESGAGVSASSSSRDVAGLRESASSAGSLGAPDSGSLAESLASIGLGAADRSDLSEGPYSTRLGSGDASGASDAHGASSAVSDSDSARESSAFGLSGFATSRDASAFLDAFGLKADLSGGDEFRYSLDWSRVDEAWSVSATPGSAESTWLVETDKALFSIGTVDPVSAGESSPSIVVGSADFASAPESLAVSATSGSGDAASVPESQGSGVVVASAEAVDAIDAGEAHVSARIVYGLDSASAADFGAMDASASSGDFAHADADIATAFEAASVLGFPGSAESPSFAEGPPSFSLGDSESGSAIDPPFATILAGSSDSAGVPEGACPFVLAGASDSASYRESWSASAIAAGADVGDAGDMIHASDAAGFVPFAPADVADGYYSILLGEDVDEFSATLILSNSIDPFHPVVIGPPRQDPGPYPPPVNPPPVNPPPVNPPTDGLGPLKPERRLIVVRKAIKPCKPPAAPPRRGFFIQR